MTFAIAEIFRTLQGEGVLAGTPAVFVRFAGCNLWNGDNATRERDAVAHDAKCPRWCDTDFVVKAKFTHYELVERIVSEGTDPGGRRIPLIVFTGGEPLLQLTASLVNEIKRRMPGTQCAVETNGTIEPDPKLEAELDHVCVSPKVPADRLKLARGTELKVVFPAFNPLEYEALEGHFQHLLVSPEAITSTVTVGHSLVVREVEQAAARFCLMHPRWRLSLQMHKHLGLR